MTKEEAIEILNNIKDPFIERKELSLILDFLDIKYQRLSCRKCCIDYYNIAREELGLVESAAELSNFNGGYKYLKNRPFRWVRKNGESVIINKNTPIDVIEEFITAHKGYYIKIEEK